ncbi:TPA: hypothetical protein TXZ07_001616 [Streptococcus suis]|nr:hypothetical protein [Streptococcus suis]
MIPKFRVWVEAEETMHPVISLDWSGIDDNLTVFVPMGHTSSRAVSIDNAVLMQSTGLFDINGKEIFEGDKIIYNRDDYTVVRIDAAIGLAFIKNGEKTSFKPLVNGMINFDRVEVIGNIYENPELVEGI